MKTKRILSIVLCALMILAATPVLTLAEGAVDRAEETRKLARLDEAWEPIAAAEEVALGRKASASATAAAAYSATIGNPLVDPGSIVWESPEQFAFTVDGMHCLYYYRARNVELVSNVSAIADEIMSDADAPSASDVLLVGPYYGSDGNFTDQYKTEANSLADALGATRTLLSGAAATGPAIAQNFTDKAIVIFDSHGTQSGTSSYLCLTTNSGITQQDYNNGWAVYAGSAAYIDGRYIKNHVNGTLSDCMVWMAICEGMKKEGKGTTGYALLEAGASCVYGYSQSVTFSGDYEYEKAFWTEMKKGKTVADAIVTMKRQYGAHDPYGDAYPIVMSEVDPFPANPDSSQTVNCEWTMFPDVVELESYSLDTDSVEISEYEILTVNFNREPYDANDYKLEWSSEDTSVATVTGNKTKAKIVGVSAGETTVNCAVKKNDQVIDTLSISVKVNPIPTLNEAANVPGGRLEFTTAGSYKWHAVGEGDHWVAMSGNQGADSTTSVMKLVLDMKKDEKLTFEWRVSSEADKDFLRFYINGSNTPYAKITGETGWAEFVYTAPQDGTYTFKWTYYKNSSNSDNDDSGYVRNVMYDGQIPEPPVEEPLLGDVNFDEVVNELDVMLVMRYAMKLITFTDEQIAVADFNGDGSVNLDDALLILRYVTEIEE